MRASAAADASGSATGSNARAAAPWPRCANVSGGSGSRALASWRPSSGASGSGAAGGGTRFAVAAATRRIVASISVSFAIADARRLDTHLGVRHFVSGSDGAGFGRHRVKPAASRIAAVGVPACSGQRLGGAGAVARGLCFRHPANRRLDQALIDVRIHAFAPGSRVSSAPPPASVRHLRASPAWASPPCLTYDSRHQMASAPPDPANAACQIADGIGPKSRSAALECGSGPIRPPANSLRILAPIPLPTLLQCRRCASCWSMARI